MTDTKRTLLIEADLFRPEVISNTLTFPGANDRHNKRLTDLVLNAQDDFIITFVTNNIEKDIQKLSGFLPESIQDINLKNWNDLDQYRDYPENNVIILADTQPDDIFGRHILDNNILNIHSRILRKENPYEAILTEIQAEIDEQNELRELFKTIQKTPPEELDTILKDAGLEQLPPMDLDALLDKIDDIPRQAHAQMLLPNILAEVFNQQEVSGFLATLPDRNAQHADDHPLFVPDTRTAAKSDIKAYVETALGLDENKPYSLFNIRDSLKRIYKDAASTTKPRTVKNDALNDVTQIIPGKNSAAIPPVIRAIHGVIRDYNDKYPFPS